MSASYTSTRTPQIRLAFLLLAAGEGSRLGSHPKALLKKEGLSLLERFLQAAQACFPVEIVVVTGFHADAIESEIAKINPSLACPGRVIRNPKPERGQASSVRLGLETFHDEFDALLVALSDQPGVGADEIQNLMEAFANRDINEEMILPMVDGQRGNPVLFSKKVIEEILRVPGLVCRAYMDAHSDQVREMHTDNRAFVLDVDTPEGIQEQKLTLR